MKAKLILAVLFAAIFFAFSYWYGGKTTPVSVEEGEQFIEAIQKAHAESGDDEIEEFLNNMREMIPNDDGREFYVVNLDNLKEGEAAKEADAKYASCVFPALLQRGGHPVLIGSKAGYMLGREAEDIDRVAVVRYRSLRDLLDMNLDPSMIEGVPHKLASLEHTEVFIIRPILTAAQIKLILAMALALLTLLLFKVVDLFARRRQPSDQS